MTKHSYFSPFYRNGSEWNRLRGALRRLMSVPRAARPYLPHTYVIMQDFMKRLEKIRDPSTGEIPEFFHEIRAWNFECSYGWWFHYNDFIMGAMASQITSLAIVYSTVYLKKKTSKLCVTGLCEGNSPVTGGIPTQRASNAKMFPFDDVIMSNLKKKVWFKMCKNLAQYDSAINNYIFKEKHT